MDNKDLLRQYVDSGLVIPDYQIKRLSGSLLNTYLRKRLIAVENGGIHSTEYEYSLFDEEGKKKFIMNVIRRNGYLPPGYLELGSDELKTVYVNGIITNKDSMDYSHFRLLSDELKLKYIEYRVKGHWNFEESFLRDETPEFMHKYYEIVAKHTTRNLSDDRYMELPNDLKQVYLDYHLDGSDTEKQYKDRTPESKLKYITSYKNRELSREQLFRTPNKLAMIYLKQRMGQGWDLKDYEQKRYETLINGQ